jgi:uncharacterized Zn finger protein
MSTPGLPTGVTPENIDPASIADLSGRLHSALLPCESCGRETPHRIVHLDRSTAVRSGTIRGVARCQTCGLVGPFSSVTPASRPAALIVSDGDRSDRVPIRLPASARVRVGETLADWPELLHVRKVDDRRGRSVSSARGEEVATVWTVRDTGPSVRFSLIEGRITRAGRIPVAPGTFFEVGGSIELPGVPATVVGLRARNRTWRRPGDRFEVGEVQRVYARRTVSPPAGRSGWSTARERPEAWASSISRSARDRSSPGVRRNRRAPRERTAEGGPTVQRSSPS